MGANGVTRRTMLLGVGAFTLAGCGVRFESDGPWFVPTPSPDPAGPSVLAERSHVAALRSALPDVRPAVAPRLVSLTDTHLAALDAALAALDPPVPVPEERTSAAVAPTTAGPSSVPTPGRSASALTPTDAARVALSGLRSGELSHLDRLPPRVAPLLTASAAQRIVTASRLSPVPSLDTVLRDVSWRATSPAVARELLDAVRSAAYAVEVATPRLPQARRGAALRTLDTLRSVEAGLVETAPDAPPRPLGHHLPGRVDSPARAATLLDGVLTRLGEVAIATVTPTVAALDEAPGTASSTMAAPASASAMSPGTPAAPPGAGALAPVLCLAVLAELSRLGLGGRPRPLPLLAAQAAATAGHPVGPTPTATAPAAPSSSGPGTRS